MTKEYEGFIGEPRLEPKDVYERPIYHCTFCDRAEINEDEIYCEECQARVCQQIGAPCYEVPDITKCEHKGSKEGCPFEKNINLD